MTNQLRVALVVVLCSASPALAHFTLTAPPAYSAQDAVGSPQLSAPCGQADPGAPVVATDAVTELMEGAQFPVTFVEEVFHPGHYRVAIATDQSGLPADPPVTAGTTPCGSTTIEQTPTLPILGDGLAAHTASFGSTPQTMQVQLPPGFTCDHCVLQVIQFMSMHNLNVPGGCFYHHCATVTVTANGPDAGMAAGSAGGCCDAGGSSRDDLVIVLVVALVLVRRRCRQVAGASIT